MQVSFFTQPHAEHTQIIIIVIQYAYCSHISFFKDKPNAKHTQTILSVIIDVIHYAYCSYISFFKDKPHAKHTQTIISVIQYGYFFYLCHSRIKFTMFKSRSLLNRTLNIRK